MHRLSNALEEAELKKFQKIVYMQSPYMHRQQLITVFPYHEIQAFCQSTLWVCLISSTWKYFRDHELSCVTQCHPHFRGQIYIYTLLPSSVPHFLREVNQPRGADGSHGTVWLGIDWDPGYLEWCTYQTVQTYAMCQMVFKERSTPQHSKSSFVFYQTFLQC